MTFFPSLSPELAAEHYRRALGITAALLDHAPEEFRYQRRHVMLLEGQAAALRSLGEREGALQHLRQALEMLQEMLAKRPTNAEVEAARHAAFLALADLSLEARDFSCGSRAQSPGARDRRSRVKQCLNGPVCALAACRCLCEFWPVDHQRLAGWREARASYQKALDLWDGWSQHAVSSVFNTTRRDQVARELEQCYTALNRPSPSPR